MTGAAPDEEAKAVGADSPRTAQVPAQEVTASSLTLFTKIPPRPFRWRRAHEKAWQAISALTKTVEDVKAGHSWRHFALDGVLPLSDKSVAVVRAGLAQYRRAGELLR